MKWTEHYRKLIIMGLVLVTAGFVVAGFTMAWIAANVVTIALGWRP